MRYVIEKIAKMGNENTTPAPAKVHEEIIKIINSNVQQSAHLEKTASATSMLAYIGLSILIILVVYVVYRVIINIERMKTQEAINRSVSLASVLSNKWSENKIKKNCDEVTSYRVSANSRNLVAVRNNKRRVTALENNNATSKKRGQVKDNEKNNGESSNLNC